MRGHQVSSPGIGAKCSDGRIPRLKDADSKKSPTNGPEPERTPKKPEYLIGAFLQLT